MSESVAKPEQGCMTTEEASMRKIFSVLPPAPKYYPVKDAIGRASELGEKMIVTTLGYFATMPQSTSIIANPVLHHIPVDCDGTTITLDIRSFTIRGVVPEADIVEGKEGPVAVILAGLFGQATETAEGATSKEAALADLIDRKFFGSIGFGESSDYLEGSQVERVAKFVKEFPGLGPEVAMQHFSILRKAILAKRELQECGVNEERDPMSLLIEMITVHMEGVAVGAVSAYMNHLHRANPQLGESELSAATSRFVEEERARGRNAFEVCYSLILGHHANEHESLILERMGTIQIHHGSAGSNMVARYMATLHTLSVSDFFTASQMAMDGARHFGAIHDMSDFVQQLEPLTFEERGERIREKMLGGGLPTFGHPEIAAAGRGHQMQQDPRPAIYIDPLFSAIDAAQVVITARQHERLSIAHQIYHTAFVQGVLKPQREHEGPLRLTPNTDFGAWCVQEALGIEEADRTLLTYIFRGFGWMMDAREQLQQKMIRPVIAPAPEIIPKPGDNSTIPDLVARVHLRLTQDDPFRARQT